MCLSGCDHGGCLLPGREELLCEEGHPVGCEVKGEGGQVCPLPSLLSQLEGVRGTLHFPGGKREVVNSRSLLLHEQ